MPKPQAKDIIRVNYEILQAWASENKGEREVKLLQLFDLLRQYDFERYMGHFLQGGKELKQRSLRAKDKRSLDDKQDEEISSYLKGVKKETNLGCLELNNNTD